jgi:hypothetical protein
LDLVTHINSVDVKRCKHSNDKATYIWHCRLGHIGVKRMKKLHNDGLLDSLDFDSFDTCEPCLLGKMTRTPLSWYFGDSSHGGGLMERLDDVQRWVRLEIVLLEHQRLPRFRAFHSGGNTPTSCLVFILSTRWLTRLLELYCLEVEEDEFDLPSLRVQAPLYRRGPGYRFGV